MHILVTNDDGVQHDGLFALQKAARNFGEVTVLAPDKNWSACGHVKTMHRPMRINEVELKDGTKAFASDGAPSDCVALAMLGFTKPVDLVLTGINPHANVGDDVTYSGTVTSAMEAVLADVPGIAFSLDTLPSDKDRSFAEAEKIIVDFLTKYLEKDVRKDVVLSVNIPYVSHAELKGTRITRMGRRVYKDELVVQHDPFGRPIYWIGGEFPGGIADEGTEIKAIKEGYLAVTPIKMDMTAHERIAEIEALGW